MQYPRVYFSLLLAVLFASLVPLRADAAATGNAMNADVKPQPAGTTRIDGFRQLEKASNTGPYHSPRNEAHEAAWAYARTGQQVSWRSAPVPEPLDTPTVTLAWECVLTGGGNFNLENVTEPLAFTLHLFDKPLLTFEAGIRGDTRWQADDGSGAELFFDMTGFDQYYDLGGIMYLTLPAEKVQPNAPVRLTVHGKPANAKCFFMLSRYTNTIAYIDSGAIANNPDRFHPPKALTKSDFLYDGSGFLRLIERSGSDRWNGLDEVRSRIDRTRTTADACERVIFRDTYTHVPVWLLSRYHARHHYSTLLTFNADGRFIKLSGIPRGLYDMATARPVDWNPHGLGEWDRVRPFIVYRAKRLRGAWNDPQQVNAVVMADIRTGEETRLATVTNSVGFWPQSDTGELVWWHEGRQDVGYTVASCRTDGSDFRRVHVNGGLHQAYLLREPQARGNYWLYSHNANTVDAQGNITGGGHHIVVDIRSGEKEVAPAYAGVHEGHSPDGWAVFAGSAGSLYPDRMPPHRIVTVFQSLETHTTWNSFEPNWAVEAYNVKNGSDIIKLNPWTDDVVVVCSANQNPPDHVTWSTCQFPNLSPDGTKILYFSSMLESHETGHEYIAVAKRPEAPQAVTAERTGEGVRVQWTPHALSREIRGYHVLRSSRCRGEYEVVSDGLLSDCAFTDTAPPDGPLFYRIRAQEYSGLVSDFSADAALDAEGADRWIFLEAESGTATAPMRVSMDGRCSGLHLAYVSEYPEETDGKLQIRFTPSASGPAVLWARVAAKPGSRIACSGPTLPAATIETKHPEWAWHRVGTLPLEADNTATFTVTASTGVRLDRFIVTTDAHASPKGLGRVDDRPPAAPAAPRAVEVHVDGVTLAWAPPAQRTLSHYNVYCGSTPDFACNQARLILSPPADATRVRDWGLEPDLTCYYKITAVDWDGGESAPSGPVEVRTGRGPEDASSNK